MPYRKKLFGVAFNQLCTTSITSSSSAKFWPRKYSFIGPNKWKSDGAILNFHSSVDIRRFHTLWPQKTNNASLLFHGASWQWSGHVVWPTAHAQTAWSSRPLYDILLRSHFVSRNKIFRCAYLSMYFRIKFLLFNDFLSYIYIYNMFFWLYVTILGTNSGVSLPKKKKFPILKRPVIYACVLPVPG